MANSTHPLYIQATSAHTCSPIQGSIGKVDKEAPEKYEVIVKQFKRRAVIRKGNNKTNPENFQGML